MAEREVVIAIRGDYKKGSSASYRAVLMDTGNLAKFEVVTGPYLDMLVEEYGLEPQRSTRNGRVFTKFHQVFQEGDDLGQA